MIATNTIGQGDTRATGLEPILARNGSIRRATKRLKWPGEATVVVSVVHLTKCAAGSSFATEPILNNKSVSRISAYLVEGNMDRTPERLGQRPCRAFTGSKIYGIGFTFDDVEASKGRAEPLNEMKRLISEDARNAEIIKPYIGGEEVNSSPRQSHHRYVIDFDGFPLRRDPTLVSWGKMSEGERRDALRNGIVPSDYLDPVAADWPRLLAIVEARVKPERQNH